MKKLKNIEDKTDNQLAIQKGPPNMKSIYYSIRERMSLKTKNMLDKLVIAENSIDYRTLYFTGGKKEVLNLGVRFSNQFIMDIS